MFVHNLLNLEGTLPDDIYTKEPTRPLTGMSTLSYQSINSQKSKKFQRKKMESIENMIQRTNSNNFRDNYYINDEINDEINDLLSEENEEKESQQSKPNTRMGMIDNIWKSWTFQARLKHFLSASKAFRALDLNNDGELSPDEIRQLLEAFGFYSPGEEESEVEFEIFFKEIDKNGDGHIDYDEFLSYFQDTEFNQNNDIVPIQERKVHNNNNNNDDNDNNDMNKTKEDKEAEKHNSYGIVWLGGKAITYAIFEFLQNLSNYSSSLKKCFLRLDLDHNGFLSKNELRAGINSMGLTINDFELDELFKSFDLNDDGQIPYSEFLEIVNLVSNYQWGSQGLVKNNDLDINPLNNTNNNDGEEELFSPEEVRVFIRSLRRQRIKDMALLLKMIDPTDRGVVPISSLHSILASFLITLKDEELKNALTDTSAMRSRDKVHYPKFLRWCYPYEDSNVLFPSSLFPHKGDRNMISKSINKEIQKELNDDNNNKNKKTNKVSLANGLPSSSRVYEMIRKCRAYDKHREGVIRTSEFLKVMNSFQCSFHRQDWNALSDVYCPDIKKDYFNYDFFFNDSLKRAGQVIEPKKVERIIVKNSKKEKAKRNQSKGVQNILTFEHDDDDDINNYNNNNDNNNMNKKTIRRDHGKESENNIWNIPPEELEKERVRKLSKIAQNYRSNEMAAILTVAGWENDDYKNYRNNKNNNDRPSTATSYFSERPSTAQSYLSTYSKKSTKSKGYISPRPGTSNSTRLSRLSHLSRMESARSNKGNKKSMSPRIPSKSPRSFNSSRVSNFSFKSNNGRPKTSQSIIEDRALSSHARKYVRPISSSRREIVHPKAKHMTKNSILVQSNALNIEKKIWKTIKKRWRAFFHDLRRNDPYSTQFITISVFRKELSDFFHLNITDSQAIALVDKYGNDNYENSINYSNLFKFLHSLDVDDAHIERRSNSTESEANDSIIASLRHNWRGIMRSFKSKDVNRRGMLRLSVFVSVLNKFNVRITQDNESLLEPFTNMVQIAPGEVVIYVKYHEFLRNYLN